MFARLAFSILCLSLAGGLAFAQSEEDFLDDPDESLKPERCVHLGRIDRTDVLDDRNIIFYMKGDKIYRNVLPHRCPGLRRRDAFMYRTSMSQLCNVDIITVLESRVVGFLPGASCGLGMFYPVTEQEVKALKEEVERARKLRMDDPE